MITGLGVDIVDIDRITPLNEKLVDKVLTDKEKAVLTLLKTKKAQIEYFGGRFAAKEAFAKAMGTGIGKIAFKDCEMINDEMGCPILTYLPNLSTKIHVSLSHSDQSIVAVVILEKES